ncbi:MAG: oxygen-independent coproporphyrinogen III oxidase [Burkholderiaceae bacterium]
MNTVAAIPAKVQNDLSSDDLIRALDIRAPRYTSYPTADRFSDAFGTSDYQRQLKALGSNSSSPLSLYLHVPFCESLCYFCACNKMITRNHDKAEPYLRRVIKELDLVLDEIGQPRQVGQMHWGGGSPTFLRPEEIRKLMANLRDRVELLPNGEYSIEIDPRAASREQIAVLGEEGFNRMSLGVQDFNPEVQRAVNRIQPAEMTERVLRQARAAGFRSTNFDLIYGLPRQSVNRFESTMQAVVEMRPERIALYNYAHLPSAFKAQRLIQDADLPDAEEKFAIFQMAVESLENAGYEYIGMDHFALPDDELAVARRAANLHRNFQGYSTQPDCDLIALGASAISKIGTCYSQNLRGIKEYCDALDRGVLPVLRGVALNSDDLLRRELIMELMCQGRIDKQAVSASTQLAFDDQFANELTLLSQYEQLGLVINTDNFIQVTESGRRKALRAIGAIFDHHLQTDQTRRGFSRVL